MGDGKKQLAVLLREDEPNVQSVAVLVQKKPLIIALADIENTQYKPPVLLLNGSIIITTKQKQSYKIPVAFNVADEMYAEKLKIDHAAQINAFEPGKFRSPYVFTADIMNYIPVLVVVPLGLMQIIAGIFMFQIGAVGIVVGLLLILIGSLTIFFVVRSAMNAVEGHCPICDKVMRTNLSTPFLYCTKCKEKVSTGNGYFEVK